jgi:uncharacterized membrane protein YqjE
MIARTSFPDEEPPLAAPGSVPGVVVEALMHRGELALLELEEATQHVTRTTAAAVLSATLLLLGGFAGTFAVAAAVWNRPDRGLILALITVAYLAAAAALAFVAAGRLRSWTPFAEIRRQLHEDGACLRGALNRGKR